MEGWSSEFQLQLDSDVEMIDTRKGVKNKKNTKVKGTTMHASPRLQDKRNKKRKEGASRSIMF